MKELKKDGKVLLYQIEKKKIKHTYFRLKKDHIYVTTNKFVKESQILELLYHKFDILHHKLNHRTQLQDNQIRLWQKNYMFIVTPGRFKYIIDDDKVICHSNLENIEKLRKLIYKQEIILMMEKIRYKILNTLNKVEITELPYKYKYLKSKYGSYHKKHQEITLNTFLATIDPIFLEYVIYHEYAHHKVFNHSKAFYQVLDNMMLNHKNIQKTLKKMEIL